MDDILFAKIDIPMLDKNKAASEILSIDDSFWFWDNYRATNMLPLMTKESIPGQRGSSNIREGKFCWLSYTPSIIKDWFEDYVFPWMGMHTRVMALKTVPKFQNLEHIDCSKDEVGTTQHKFRAVIQGKTETLYFKTATGDVYAPAIDQPFVIDGGWPHGMTNFTDDVKITLAAGSPWNSINDFSNTEVLLKRSRYSMPASLNKFL